MKTVTTLPLLAGFLLFLLPAVTFSSPVENLSGTREYLQHVRGSLLEQKYEKIDFDIRSLLRSLITKTQEEEEGDHTLQKALKTGSFWDIVLSILYLLGISNEDIAAILASLEEGITNILSKLPPEDVMAVEYAAGDILRMLQTGDIDFERLQADLQIIYTIMWPHVAPEYQPIITAFFEFIFWLWQLINGYKLPEISSMSAGFPTSSFGALLSNVLRH